MRRVLALLGSLLLSAVSMADQYAGAVQVTAPTTREDGTPLAPSEIKAYELYFQCNATPVQQGTDILPPPPLSKNPLFLTEGVYHVCVRVVDQQDRASALSNIFIADVVRVDGPSAPTLDGIIVTCPSGVPPRVTAIPGGQRIECDAP